MNERALPQPLPHPTALALTLHRWLALLGAPRELDEVRERCLERRDLFELARRCAGSAVHVRAVELTPAAIASLRVPALLPLRTGSVALLRTVGPLRVELEDGTGQTTIVSRAELLTRSIGIAIEALPTLGRARSLLHGWLQLLLHERRRTIEVLALSALLPALGLLAPLLAGQALDGALVGGATRQLLWLAFGCFLAAVLQSWLGYLRQRVLLALDARVQTTALREAFTRLLARPYLEVCGLSLGEQTRPMDSAQRVTQAPADYTFAPLLDLLMLFSYALGLCLMSWSAGAYAWLLVLLMTLVAAVLAWHGARVERARSEVGARALGRLHELIHGVTAIRAAGATRACIARWFSLLVDERTLGHRRDRIELTLWCSTLGAQHAATLVVLGFGGHAVLEGALSIGGLAAALIYVEGLNGASARLIRACQRFAVMVPHLQQVRALLARDPIARSSEQVSSLAEPDDDLAIVLEDVWFRYAPAGPWILRGYSLRVRRGELLRIGGASGQGKTTVLRLIAGLIEPERGSVRVCGMAPSRARALLTYLPQDAHLLEGSIATNLMLMSGVTPKALAAALRATELDGWLASLPMGQQTLLPPGGRTLSGGQRQWIVLTAAVASQRPIVLLDEATAHLDRARREQLRLEELFAKRTVVMVSHES